MSLEAKLAARRQEQRKARRARVGWGLVALLVIPLLVAFSKGWPTMEERLNTVLHPAPRPDLLYVGGLDNSGSACSWDIKKEVAWEEMKVARSLGRKPVDSLFLRFGSVPVEIFAGSSQEQTLLKALKDYYVHVPPDPQPNTYLAPVLETALQRAQANPKAVLLITVGTDNWDDPGAVKEVCQRLKRRGRVCMLVHAVPIHNPKKARVQMQKREQARRSLAPLGGEARVVSKVDFPDAVHRWLPGKLKELGFRP
jgi:hypothetical protein